MVVVPAATPKTEPVAALTVPTAVLLLLHTPAPTAVASLSVVDIPVQTEVAPVIAPATGVALTVTVAVTEFAPTV